MKGIWPMHRTRLVASFMGGLILGVTVASGLATAGQLSHFPSPHQPWTTSEYVDFYFAHYNGNRALPHLRAEDTRLVFQRIVDPENVLRIIESSASHEQKRAGIAMILATIGEIRAAYGYAVFVGEPLQEELVQVQSFLLFLINSAIKLEDKMGTLSAGNHAWKTAIWNVVGSLAERETYSSRQLASLSAALDLNYPEISSILSDADKQKFRLRISEIAAAESDGGAREAHLQLLRTAHKY
jgi:hypothetical protein